MLLFAPAEKFIRINPYKKDNKNRRKRRKERNMLYSDEHMDLAIDIVGWRRVVEEGEMIESDPDRTATHLNKVGLNSNEKNEIARTVNAFFEMTGSPLRVALVGIMFRPSFNNGD
jgi:hypothetical protein